MELVGRLKSLATDNPRKSLAILASVVLVVLIGFDLARLIWLVVEGPPAPAPVIAVAAGSPGGSAPRREYTPEMAGSWNLFGDAAAQPEAGDADGAPVTSLSLQLLGVFSTLDERLAGAVIAERGKEGELYRLGSAVPGGATLEKVEKDQVLLRRRGQLETLRFEALASSGATEPPSKGIDTLGGYRQMKDKSGRDSDADGDAQSKGRQLLASLSGDLRDNPDGVASDLGLKPLTGSGGAPGGYQVTDGASAEVMRNLGLRPGDVIMSVNGKPLGNLQNDRGMVDEVKASGEARVEIRRGSQTFTVNYPL